MNTAASIGEHLPAQHLADGGPTPREPSLNHVGITPIIPHPAQPNTPTPKSKNPAHHPRFPGRVQPGSTLPPQPNPTPPAAFPYLRRQNAAEQRSRHLIKRLPRRPRSLIPCSLPSRAAIARRAPCHPAMAAPAPRRPFHLHVREIPGQDLSRRLNISCIVPKVPATGDLPSPDSPASLLDKLRSALVVRHYSCAPSRRTWLGCGASSCSTAGSTRRVSRRRTCCSF
jgi:hypothetical protein